MEKLMQTEENDSYIRGYQKALEDLTLPTSKEGGFLGQRPMPTK